MLSASLSQSIFRGRNDDGSETTATWKAAANTNWTQTVDENFRVRFEILETAGGGENNVPFQLQYNPNGIGWSNVTDTSTVVRSSLSANFADDDTTTQQLGTATFITPNAGMDEVNGLTGTITFSGNDAVEVEFSVQIRSVDVNDADTIQLRVVRSPSTLLEAYTNIPSITVSEAAAPANFDAELAAESDIAAEAAFDNTVPVNFDAEFASESDVAQESAFAVEVGLTTELAAESNVAAEAVFDAAAQTVFDAENAVESDTALETTFTTQPVFTTELAAEVDAAFEVVLLADPVLAAELAAESDVAIEAELQVFIPGPLSTPNPTPHTRTPVGATPNPTLHTRTPVGLTSTPVGFKKKGG